MIKKFLQASKNAYLEGSFESWILLSPAKVSYQSSNLLGLLETNVLTTASKNLLTRLYFSCSSILFLRTQDRPSNHMSCATCLTLSKKRNLPNLILIKIFSITIINRNTTLLTVFENNMAMQHLPKFEPQLQRLLVAILAY